MTAASHLFSLLEACEAEGIKAPPLCECGCGENPGVYAHSRPDGAIAGQPRRFVHGHSARNNGIATRFKALAGPDYLVEDRGYTTLCWVWRRSTNNTGYGSASVNGRSVMAHRHYYITRVGEIGPGLELDHLCRVRSCVNPDHMEPVTHAENVRRGSRVKTTVAIAAEIRWLYAFTDLTQTELGRRYDLHPSCVSRIVNGKKWSE